MRRFFTILGIFAINCIGLQAQDLSNKHNPEADVNLSPAHNKTINPTHNSSINPKLNWNINPYKNGTINPQKVNIINPKLNLAINPMENQEMNPMFSIYMSPKAESWKGLYIFDTNDKLFGFITQYSQDIMMQFDKDANFTLFYIRTAKGTYNQFTLTGEWTGSFLCFDSMSGFNLFDKNCEWTGMHIK